MRNQLVLCWSGSPSAFGYRMGWLRALLARPKASVSLSEFRCAVYTVRKVWLSKSRQGRSGRNTSSLCSSTIQSMRKNAEASIPGDERDLLEDNKRVRETIVHIHNSQNQWIPPSVNHQQIHRRSICKSGTAGAYSPSSLRRSRSAKQRDVDEECCGSPFLRL